MIFVRSVEDAEHVVIVWTHSGAVPETLFNPNGVTHSHVTEVVRGRIEFKFGDRPALVLGSGEQIVLPVGAGYDAVWLQSPAEVRCHYPRAVSGAVESVDHLRGSRPVRWASRDGDVSTREFSLVSGARV